MILSIDAAFGLAFELDNIGEKNLQEPLRIGKEGQRLQRRLSLGPPCPRGLIANRDKRERDNVPPETQRPPTGGDVHEAGVQVLRQRL